MMKKVYVNYLLDAVIALAFLIAAFGGIAFLFMGEGGYQGGRNAAFQVAFLGIPRSAWSDLHTLSSLVMITGVVVHLILHWEWIKCVTKDVILSPFHKKEQVCEVNA
jgi:hypothetical protein